MATASRELRDLVLSEASQAQKDKCPRMISSAAEAKTVDLIEIKGGGGTTRGQQRQGVGYGSTLHGELYRQTRETSSGML